MLFYACSVLLKVLANTIWEASQTACWQCHLCQSFVFWSLLFLSLSLVFLRPTKIIHWGQYSMFAVMDTNFSYGAANTATANHWTLCSVNYCPITLSLNWLMAAVTWPTHSTSPGWVISPSEDRALSYWAIVHWAQSPVIGSCCVGCSIAEIRVHYSKHAVLSSVDNFCWPQKDQW